MRKIISAIITLAVAAVLAAPAPSPAYQNVANGLNFCINWVSPDAYRHLNEVSYTPNMNWASSDTIWTATRHGNEDVTYNYIRLYNPNSYITGYWNYVEAKTRLFLSDEYYCRIKGPNERMSMYTLGSHGVARRPNDRR